MVSSLKSCETRTNEPISLHTSFKIGGRCDSFVIPESMDGIKSVLTFVNQNKLPLLVIGNGTNLLFSDDGFSGVVMQIGEPYFCGVGAGFTCESETIRELPLQVEAGISISRLLEITVEKGLSGLEFMSGIPGTLGGAIVMNAGAQRKRIGEIIERVKVINRKGETYWIENEEIGFEYRESRFKRSVPYSAEQEELEIILSAELKLKRGDPCKIKARIQEIVKNRESRLPLEFPSAGCVFKNPKDKIAGELIELASCKGLRIGDAQVSTLHANFIVNLGNASYKDVKTLVEEVQQKVYQKFKVSLDPELIIL